MLSIHLTGDCAALQTGLSHVLAAETLFGASGDLTIEVSRLPKDGALSLRCSNQGGLTIAYRETCDFFHGLLQLIENAGNPGFSIERTARFRGMHAMIDVSRNAAYTVPEMKKFLARLALTGYTGCLLYMEDTYELTEYPYFGTMRARYTQAELRELDACAVSLGVELIPCIQTLAHLGTALRWDYTAPMRDAPGLLLVEEEKTYEFIEAMFRELSEVFTCRRFHIGMDEAASLGRGKYLQLHGLVPQRELMLRHIERVGKIAAKYGISTMIWDDMLYREEHDSGMDYFTSGATLRPEEMARLPKDMEFVYWDYYKAKPEEYDLQMSKRAALPTIFAGASWKWNGWVPCYDKCSWTGRAALIACEKHGLEEVMLTMWADDGAETPLGASLPQLALYGEGRFAAPTDEAVDRCLRVISGSSWADFAAIERIELLPDLSRPNLNCINSAKHVLYSDLLQGLFDRHYVDRFIPQHYAACAAELETIAKSAPAEEMRRVFALYAKLARTIAHKALLGNDLRAAYRAGDKTELRRLMEKVLALIPLLEDFHASVEAVWSLTCKGSGLEVLDYRLGGQSGRCCSVAERIRRYLEGELAAIDELDQDVLPFGSFWPEGEKYPSYNPYAKIASANAAI